MPNVFAVVGEHRDDPAQLLLRGSDARFYAYADDGRLRPVEPSDEWEIDKDAPLEYVA